MCQYLKDSLPLEIKKIIAGFLDDRSRRNVRVSSTEWFHLVKYDNFVFYYTSEALLPEVIARMAKYDNQIGITFRKSSVESILTPLNVGDVKEAFFGLSRLTNLTRLEFENQSFDCSMPNPWLRFTTLTNLQYFKAIEKYKQSYLALLPFLTSLKEVDGADEWLVRRMTALTDLQRLQVTLSGNNMELFERLKFPERLSSLSVYSGSGGSLKLDILTRLTGLRHLLWINREQVFPHSLLPNLEDLNVRGATADRFDLNPNLTCLKLTYDPQRINELTHLKKLKSLAIGYSPSMEIKPLEYLTAMKDLESLEIVGQSQIHADLICPYLVTTKLTHLQCRTVKLQISHEISRLTCLEILVCNYGAEMHWLTSLSNLTALQSLNCTDNNELYISRMTGLKSLAIRQIDQIYDQQRLILSDLINLEHLNLTVDMKPECISNLTAMTRLSYLCIGSKENFDISFLTIFTDLKTLQLSSQNSPQYWNIITTLTTLRELHVYGLVDDNQALQLKPLTGLTRLVMNGNVTQQSRRHFTNIYNLV